MSNENLTTSSSSSIGESKKDMIFSLSLVVLFIISVILHEIGHMIALISVGVPFHLGSDISGGLFLAVYPHITVLAPLKFFIYLSGGLFASIVTIGPALKIGRLALVVPLIQLGMAIFEVFRWC